MTNIFLFLRFFSLQVTKVNANHQSTNSNSAAGCGSSQSSATNSVLNVNNNNNSIHFDSDSGKFFIFNVFFRICVCVLAYRSISVWIDRSIDFWFDACLSFFLSSFLFVIVYMQWMEMIFFSFFLLVRLFIVPYRISSIHIHNNSYNKVNRTKCSFLFLKK